MTSRTIVENVTFTRPFLLRGMEAEQPAGTYVVETDEELIESLSFTAYRRTASWIRLPVAPGMGNGVQISRIEPDELAEALK